MIYKSRELTDLEIKDKIARAIREGCSVSYLKFLLSQIKS